MKIFYDFLELPEATTLSESTIQELIRTGDFPQARKLSGRRVGWLVSEIFAWAESRPVSDLPPPPNTGAKKAKRQQCLPGDAKAM
jgi:prophage regulatory protein